MSINHFMSLLLNSLWTSTKGRKLFWITKITLRNLQLCHPWVCGTKKKQYGKTRNNMKNQNFNNFKQRMRSWRMSRVMLILVQIVQQIKMSSPKKRPRIKQKNIFQLLRKLRNLFHCLKFLLMLII